MNPQERDEALIVLGMMRVVGGRNPTVLVYGSM
jgi:hypothetical protein